jgi:hypothetical protein
MSQPSNKLLGYFRGVSSGPCSFRLLELADLPHTIRLASLGQASRISGIHPADLAALLLYPDEPRRHPTSSTDQE